MRPLETRLLGIEAFSMDYEVSRREISLKPVSNMFRTLSISMTQIERRFFKPTFPH